MKMSKFLTWKAFFTSHRFFCLLRVEIDFIRIIDQINFIQNNFFVDNLIDITNFDFPSLWRLHIVIIDQRSCKLIKHTLKHFPWQIPWHLCSQDERAARPSCSCSQHNLTYRRHQYQTLNYKGEDEEASNSFRRGKRKLKILIKLQRSCRSRWWCRYRTRICMSRIRWEKIRKCILSVKISNIKI